MPVYNGARFLRQAVTSVLDQSVGDFELLAVDDGSQDRSAEILTELAGIDSRIRFLPGPHKGLVATLNRGLAEARARWVARMDADDICSPDRLEVQLAFAARNPGVTVLGTYAWYIGETGRTLGLYKVGPTTKEEFE